VKHKLYLSASLLEFWWLAGKSSTLRLGVERRRQLCAEDVETPFMEARALVASQEEFRKRLGDREAILGASTTWTRDNLVPTDITG
jgi:hypothetical protein